MSKHDATFKTDFERIRRVDISFCTFENHIPKVIVLEFMAELGKETLIKKDITYLTDPAPPFGQRVELGHHEHIDKTLEHDKTFLARRGLIQAVIDLIKIECKESPEFVAEPINVLQIYEGGYTWLKNPTKCGF